MRILPTTALSIALVLASASTSASRTDNRDLQRCDAGLQRNVVVCNNMHAVGSDRWDTCVGTALMMHSTCVEDAFRRMATRGEDSGPV